jgi:hypothetical protein
MLQTSVAQVRRNKAAIIDNAPVGNENKMGGTCSAHWADEKYDYILKFHRKPEGMIKKYLKLSPWQAADARTVLWC